MNYDQIAELLDQAALQKKATNQISTFRSLNLEESYAVQAISISQRFIRGEKLSGIKLGFTSKAKMEQMGVHDMIWGRLTDHMLIENKGVTEMTSYIHPRAEPEIAFRLSQDVIEEMTIDNVKNVVDGIAVAIEIIDSRYENFKFSLEDVIADNCSSSGYCIGTWHDTSVDIKDVKISLKIDGSVAHAGKTSAILGNPWESMVAATRLALSHGVHLKKGDIVLAGAATAAVFMAADQDISAECEGLGSVTFKTK